jgi:hypothetical protein
VITQWQKDFQVQIGRNNAKYFDDNGWLYFTRQGIRFVSILLMLIPIQLIMALSA